MNQFKSLLVVAAATAVLSGPGLVFAQTYGEASGEVAALATFTTHTPSLSVETVKSEVLVAQRAGTLSYGEASGERMPSSQVSGLTREAVRTQTLQAHRDGTLSRHQW